MTAPTNPKDFRRVCKAAVRYVRSLEGSIEQADAALEDLIEAVELFTKKLEEKKAEEVKAGDQAGPAPASTESSAKETPKPPAPPKPGPIVEIVRRPTHH